MGHVGRWRTRSRRHRHRCALSHWIVERFWCRLRTTRRHFANQFASEDFDRAGHGEADRHGCFLLVWLLGRHLGPSLYIGGMLGGAVGLAAQYILGNPMTQPGAFALVGMGAVFAGIVRAPVTSIIIIF